MDRLEIPIGETVSEQGVLDAPSPAHPLRPTPARRLKLLLSVVIAGLALALAALMLIPAALGYQRYVITGDSMSGSIDRGSIVFDEAVPVSDLREGDVITYDPPASSGVEGPVTHRIDAIEANGKGGLRFHTAGDANEAPDPWTFAPGQPTQARVSFHVPYVGFVFAALSTRWVRILLIGLPALLIAVALLRRMRRQGGQEPEHRDRAVDQAAPAAFASAAAPVPAAPPPVAHTPPVQPLSPAAAGLPRGAFAPSPALLADLRRDVDRLRESSGIVLEELLRLRARL